MNLELVKISKTYGKERVLEDASATLGPGVVAVLGYNGAGKTTLLRMLATLAVPDTGHILLDGEVLVRSRLDQRRRFFFLEDFPKFPYTLSCIQCLSTYLRLWEVPLSAELLARIMGWLEELHLIKSAHRPATELSRGEVYKLALVALLAINPELWLFDEPFASGMDPRGLTVFRREAAKAAKEGGRIVIYTTQMVDLACGFSDRVLTIKDRCLASYDTEKDVGRNSERLAALL